MILHVVLLSWYLSSWGCKRAERVAWCSSCTVKYLHVSEEVWFYPSEVALYDRDMMIMDKTGSDWRNSIRKNGYSIRGRPWSARNRWFEAKEYLPSPSCLLTGSVDSAVFYDFVQTTLLIHLMPFDGHNPHSVVKHDNCSIHMEAYNPSGRCIVHFLPPYSSDFNPIEEAFSKEFKWIWVTMQRIWYWLRSCLSPRLSELDRSCTQVLNH